MSTLRERIVAKATDTNAPLAERRAWAAYLVLTDHGHAYTDETMVLAKSIVATIEHVDCTPPCPHRPQR